VTKSWLNECWQLRVAGCLLLTAHACGVSTTAFAQQVVSADESLGTTVTVNDTTYEITGGTSVGGTNLFHSFSNFSVPLGWTASFANTANFNNIFARVTGGNFSDIQGLIRASGSANLFLLNPNGIVFGALARLDIGGSFVATTASAIRFPNGAEFSLTSQVTPENSLLKVNPSAFLFNQMAPPPINNQSLFGLQVPNGHSLLLLGGDVNLLAGQLLALGGRVELGGVSEPASVGLNVEGNNLRLSFPDDVARANVSLTRNAQVNVRAGGGGSIAINAQNLDMLGESFLIGGIEVGSGSVESQAGDITINATGNVNLGASYISNTVRARATGNSGNINIVAESLSLTNSAIVTTSTFGRGNAGNITINAKNVAFTGASRTLTTGIQNNVESGAVGDGGIVSINSDNLEISNGAQIQTIIRGSSGFLAGGRGNAGKVNINTRDTVTITGDSNRFRSSILSFVERGAIGNGGDINITSGALRLTDGGRINTSTSGKGNAGDVTIVARDAISFDDVNSNGLNSGGVFTTVNSEAEGDAGDINITAKSFSLTNGALIASEVLLGKGNAGNVSIEASDNISLFGRSANDESSRIRSGAIPLDLPLLVFVGDGKGGDVKLQAREIFLSDGSIRTNSLFFGEEGEPKGGNIQLSATDSVTLTNGVQLSSESFVSGDGGDIDIKANSLSIDNGASVRTSVTGDGIAGKVNIDVSQAMTVTGQNSLIESTLNPEATGRGGDINIIAGSLSLSEGARLSSTTFGQGNAGNVNINARDAVTIAASSGLFASTLDNATGRGGDITVKTSDLSISDGGVVDTTSTSPQDGGDITVIANTFKAINGGQLLSTASNSGSAGDISITAQEIRLRNDSDIKTNSSGSDGGNIFLTANSILALEDSDILAFAPFGVGGKITFTTTAFLSNPLYRPTTPTTDAASLNALDGNNQVDVNASGAVSGAITGVPDISFLQNSLINLSQNLIDTNALIANSCITRSREQEGTFIITGAEGFPNRPGDASASSYPTGDVLSVKPWKKGDPIVEPQGVYRLPSGQLVLSREC
jgi:filamentous hemagglutinin family protein